MRFLPSSLFLSAPLMIFGLVALSGCTSSAFEEARADSGDVARPAPSELVPQVIAPLLPPPAARQLRIEEALTEHPVVKISRDSVHWRPKGSPCAGYFVEGPSIELVLEETQTLRIGATANNRVDMTMAVQRGDGTWICGDDGQGTKDPSLIATLEPGEHQLYFGSYARLRDLDYQVSMELAEAPNWENCEGAEAILRLTPGESADVEAKLEGEMHSCQWLLDAPNCAWFLPPHPVVCVDLSEAVNLEVRTRNASFDTALVVHQLLVDDEGVTHRGPARLFNDDTDATDTHSRVAATTQPGRYAIFVGSYRYRTEGRFELQVRAETPDSP